MSESGGEVEKSTRCAMAVVVVEEEGDELAMYCPICTCQVEGKHRRTQGKCFVHVSQAIRIMSDLGL